jgi:hypothetical protein
LQAGVFCSKFSELLIKLIDLINMIFASPSLRATGEAIQKWLIRIQIEPTKKSWIASGKALALTLQCATYTDANWRLAFSAVSFLKLDLAD